MLDDWTSTKYVLPWSIPPIPGVPAPGTYAISSPVWKGTALLNEMIEYPFSAELNPCQLPNARVGLVNLEWTLSMVIG